MGGQFLSDLPRKAHQSHLDPGRKISATELFELLTGVMCAGPCGRPVAQRRRFREHIQYEAGEGLVRGERVSAVATEAAQAVR